MAVRMIFDILKEAGAEKNPQGIMASKMWELQMHKSIDISKIKDII